MHHVPGASSDRGGSDSQGGGLTTKSPQRNALLEDFLFHAVARKQVFGSFLK